MAFKIMNFCLIMSARGRQYNVIKNDYVYVKQTDYVNAYVFNVGNKLIIIESYMRITGYL